MNTMNAIDKSFTDFLESKLMSPICTIRSILSLDLSVLFGEFSVFDKAKNSLSIIEFQNRIVVSLAGHVCAYQTVGALYEKLSETGVIYAMGIVSTERLEGEYVLHQYFSSSNRVVEPQPHKASYLYQANYTLNDSALFAAKKPLSFPCNYHRIEKQQFEELLSRSSSERS